VLTSEICIDLVRNHYLDIRYERAKVCYDGEEYFEQDSNFVLFRFDDKIRVVELVNEEKFLVDQESEWYGLLDEILGDDDFKLYNHKAGIIPSSNDRAVVPMDLPSSKNLESLLVGGSGAINFTLYGRKDSDRFVLRPNESCDSKQGAEKDTIIEKGDKLYGFINFLADGVVSVKKLYLYQTCFGDGSTLDREMVNFAGIERFKDNHLKYGRKVKPRRKKKTKKK